MLGNFSTERFFDALPYMGKGMLGIFIVIGVIIGFIVLLNKITNRKKDNK